MTVEQNHGIVITRADGGVSVMRLIDPSLPVTAQYAADMVAKWETPGHVAVSHRIVDDMSALVLPSNKEFRDAWTDTGTEVDVDMPKARVIHKAALTEARDRIITKRLEQFQIAIAGNDTAEEAKMKGLVNTLKGLDTALDNQIDNAPNPTVLAAIWHKDVPRS